MFPLIAVTCLPKVTYSALQLHCDWYHAGVVFFASLLNTSSTINVCFLPVIPSPPFQRFSLHPVTGLPVRVALDINYASQNSHGYNGFRVWGAATWCFWQIFYLNRLPHSPHSKCSLVCNYFLWFFSVKMVRTDVSANNAPAVLACLQMLAAHLLVQVKLPVQPLVTVRTVKLLDRKDTVVLFDVPYHTAGSFCRTDRECSIWVLRRASVRNDATGTRRLPFCRESSFRVRVVYNVVSCTGRCRFVNERCCCCVWNVRLQFWQDNVGPSSTCLQISH